MGYYDINKCPYCQNKDEYGFCKSTGCTYHPVETVATNYTTPIPKELIINGIKYTKSK